jgi:hypothetical protein
MTFQVNATVKRVDHRPGVVTVTMDARADEIVTAPYGGAQVAGIFSNTEGKILTAAITLELEGDESPFVGGEVVGLSGHFSVPQRVGDG